MALAGVAMAQQPNGEASPGKKKQQAAEHTQAAQPKPNANVARPHATPVKQHGAANEAVTGKGHKTHQESATAQETNVSGQPAGSASPSGERHQKGMKEHAAKASPAPTAAAVNATPAVSTATQQKGQAGQANVAAEKGEANVAAGAKKKPDQQQVQQIKAQHANFRAQPKPQQVPAVTYNQNYRIQGSERWQGPQYEVFRSYRPAWHDEGWYRSHYTRVELIGGGYYFWNAGYWYPAWGYSPSAQYYAYDGPIYVGQRAQPPDQVIADVQAELQQMGYYTGEVDGLLGPMTREALTAYQADQGLATTAAIDEPTLDSLGMA